MHNQRPTGGSTARHRAGALIAALAAALLSMFMLAQSASAAGPSLSASKTSGIAASGETISVTGSGFTPNTALFVAFCNPAVPAGGGCDMGNFKSATTDASGGLKVSIKVVAKFGTQDCTKLKCVLMTNEPADPTSTKNVATLALSFGSAAPAPKPSPSPSKSTTPPASNAGGGSAAPTLPKGTDAGQADTSSQLVTASVVAGIGVVLLLAGGGVFYLRRSRARS